jgi:hypothetical protein
MLMRAYCFKCRAKREIRNPKKVTLKNGRPATTGHLPGLWNQGVPHLQELGDYLSFSRNGAEPVRLSLY